jgi:hypothetical protein
MLAMTAELMETVGVESLAAEDDKVMAAADELMAAEDIASVTVVVATAVSSAVVQCNFFAVFLYFLAGFDIVHT